MFRLYRSIFVALTLMFALLNIAARALGSTQLSNPALRGFTEGCENKPQPCWYGIVTDESTITEAQQTLTQLGYALNKHVDTMSPISYWETDHPIDLDCKVGLIVWPFNDGPDKRIRQQVINLSLEECKNVQLGDLLLAFGDPAIAYNCSGSTGFGHPLIFDGQVWLRFEPSSRIIASPQENETLNSPDANINSIHFEYTEYTYFDWKTDNVWYGFMLPWKRDQIIFNKDCPNTG